jgi:putative endonuclease
VRKRKAVRLAVSDAHATALVIAREQNARERRLFPKQSQAGWHGRVRRTVPTTLRITYFGLLMQRGGSVYIMTNKKNGVLYTGVTSELLVRGYQHKTKHDPRSFTARYNLDKLVYYQHLSYIEEAIELERKIKAGSRKAKIKLIESMNPGWLDLFDALVREAEGR